MNKDKKIKEKITHGTRREKGRVRTSIWLAHEQCCFIRQKRSFLTCLSFLSSSQISQAAGKKKRKKTSGEEQKKPSLHMAAWGKSNFLDSPDQVHELLQ